MKAVWGIMGGMGGLASAEFVRTIYEYNAREIEQDSPVLILYSDPTFPDRPQCYSSACYRNERKCQLGS